MDGARGDSRLDLFCRTRRCLRCEAALAGTGGGAIGPRAALRTCAGNGPGRATPSPAAPAPGPNASGPARASLLAANRGMYCHWVKQFILFDGKRHPRELGTAEVEQFLTHLAVRGQVSASTQNQALNALLFLYKQVLEIIDLGRFEAVRARRPKRLPVVLAPEEVAAVLQHVQGAEGVFRLMARLLYGCGLRLMECCALRVK